MAHPSKESGREGRASSGTRSHLTHKAALRLEFGRRKITSWIMRPRKTLADSQDERLLKVRLACPDITQACDLARTFADLVRHQRGYLLLEWIRQAEWHAPKPMKRFADFLRQDFDAVTAGLPLPWSSGVVEGHVNRMKPLKRAMYGRASFGLLRTRILTQPEG